MIGRRPVNSARLVVAVALPTRAFAAAFGAAGIVVGRLQAADRVDAQRHFESLRKLPLGSTVTVRRRGVVETGWLAEFGKRAGEDCVRVRFATYESRIPVNLCTIVEPAATELERLPERRTRRGLPDESGLVTNLLGMQAAAALMQSRLECIILGNAAILRDEMISTRIAVSHPKVGGGAGTLQNLVHVRQFGKHSDAYRAEVVAARSRPTRHVRDAAPTVAVLDGSLAFSKWEQVWPHADQLILLDRTENSFSDATAEVDRLFAGRKEDFTWPGLPEVPPEVECVAFDVRAEK